MMLTEEVLATVDERDVNPKTKRARMLRATDVMPPFDREAPPEGQDGDAMEQAESASLPAPGPEAGAKGRDAVAADSEERAVVAEPLSADPAEIPKYDLAEHILAEQRRVASRRRRGPGQSQEAPAAPREEPAARVAGLEPSPQDLAELQRIVAETVARDIARLCKGPDRQPQAGL